MKKINKQFVCKVGGVDPLVLKVIYITSGYLLTKIKTEIKYGWSRNLKNNFYE